MRFSGMSSWRGTMCESEMMNGRRRPTLPLPAAPSPPTAGPPPPPATSVSAAASSRLASTWEDSTPVAASRRGIFCVVLGDDLGVKNLSTSRIDVQSGPVTCGFWP